MITSKQYLKEESEKAESEKPLLQRAAKWAFKVLPLRLKQRQRRFEINELFRDHDNLTYNEKFTVEEIKIIKKNEVVFSIELDRLLRPYGWKLKIVNLGCYDLIEYDPNEDPF